MYTQLPILAQPPMDSDMETCIHASEHKYMSTWLPMCTPHPMHSLMEPWVPLCGIVCLSQSPSFWSTTWIYVHLTAYVCSTPMHSLMESWVPLYVSVFVSQSPYFCFNTLFTMCTCISTWFYVHLALHVCSTPMDSYMETWVPLFGSVCVPVTLLLVMHLV